MSQSDPARAALARVRAAAAARRGTGSAPARGPTLSSARPDDRDPQLLGRLLDGWVRSNDYGADLAVAGLVARWPDIVGEQIARHARVVSYEAVDGGHLLVQADSAEWALQLRYLEGELRRRIDDELGRGVVSAIDVRGPGRRSSGGRLRVRTGRRSPRTSSPWSGGALPPPPG